MSGLGSDPTSSLPWSWQATYNGHVVDVARHASLHRLFDAATLCNNATLSENGALGLPTEAALLLASHRLGVVDRRLTVKRVHEVGFNSETKYMEVRCLDKVVNREVSYVKVSTTHTYISY